MTLAQCYLAELGVMIPVSQERTDHRLSSACKVIGLLTEKLAFKAKGLEQSPKLLTSHYSTPEADLQDVVEEYPSPIPSRCLPAPSPEHVILVRPPRASCSSLQPRCLWVSGDLDPYSLIGDLKMFGSISE